MDKQKKEIHSLLLPLKESTLVIPQSAVVELVRYTKVEPLLANKLFIIGVLDWRNIKVPLIAFEVLLGLKTKITPNAHIAIFNKLDSQDESIHKNFFGIILQGLPRPINISNDNLNQINKFTNDYELSHIQINEDIDATIPNLYELSKLTKNII